MKDKKISTNSMQTEKKKTRKQLAIYQCIGITTQRKIIILSAFQRQYFAFTCFSEKYSKEKHNLQINLKGDEMDLLLVVILASFIWKLLCEYRGL